jgi:aspartyl-tRNA(Asn)/glutamyl-tRNA(Gln) amidotransferase subunit A
MKSSENDSIDRRSLLRGSVVGMTGLIAAKQSELTADDTKKAAAADDAKKAESPAKPPEPEKNAASQADAEIDRRLSSITARFGDRLDSAQSMAVRGDIAANYFRARRLRAMPLNDFDGPFHAFIPHRSDRADQLQTASISNDDSIVKIAPKVVKLDDSLAFATIFELAAALRGGSFSAVELAEFYLDRLAKIGPKLNCVATLTRDNALKQAAAADQRLKAGKPLGVLDGIPYGAKDLLSAAGYPTSNGCAPYVKRVLDQDATVIRRLREAGAVLVAKLAMVECAGGLGYRQANASAFGPGLTPYDKTRWSGGSSSGSGSAVAAGLVPFAIGSETWGSITTPSSYCGLTGLRPTYGRVSRAGAFALSYSLDKIGPMARTAAETELVLKAIAGADAADHSAIERPWHGAELPKEHRFKLAVFKDGVAKAQPEVKANFDKAIEVFRQVASIEEIELPEGPFADVLITILNAESSSAFEELVDSGLVQQVTAPEDKIGGYADRTLPAMDYIRAIRLRGPLCHLFDEYMSKFDAFLTVPTAATAPVISKSFGSAYTNKSLGGPGNLCGSPAIVMPTGLDGEGLPTAIQIDARVGNELVLTKLGEYFQGKTQWHQQRPDMTKI